MRNRGCRRMDGQMNTIKQQMIESLEHSIEVAEAKIEELKKPSQKSSV